MSSRASPAVRLRVEIDELFAGGGDLATVVEQVALLTVQGVVEARRVLIALLGAAGMASDRPVVSMMSMTAHWEWPPAALLAGPLIETRAKRIVG